MYNVDHNKTKHQVNSNNMMEKNMQNITMMNNNRRRRRSKSTISSSRKQQVQKSALSMGRALVLLHLASSATAFSSGGNAGNSITPLTTTRQQQHHSALQYRNGADEYFASAIPTAPSSSYMGASSSSPTLKPTMEVTKEEQDMDEYLDYLQNRYTRLMYHHPNNKQRRRRSSPITRSFDVMTTIFARLVPSTIVSSTVDYDTSLLLQEEEEEEEQCHPLKILGVSELASQRLRERLHVATVSSNSANTTRRRNVVLFAQLKQILTNRIVSSSIRRIMINKKAGEFSVLAMLLFWVRPLF